MSKIVVQRATLDDVPGLVECSVALFAEDAGTRDATMNIGWPREHGTQAFSKTIHAADRLVLVARSEDSVIGSLNGRLGEPSDVRPVRIATLLSLYVQPEYRSDGVGAKLVAAFRTWARDAGADRVDVTAYASNDAAIRFYQRQGFVPHTLTLEASP